MLTTLRRKAGKINYRPCRPTRHSGILIVTCSRTSLPSPDDRQKVGNWKFGLTPSRQCIGTMIGVTIGCAVVGGVNPAAGLVCAVIGGVGAVITCGNPPKAPPNNGNSPGIGTPGLTCNPLAGGPVVASLFSRANATTADRGPPTPPGGGAGGKGGAGTSTSVDPNKKTGPSGFSDAHFMRPDDVLPYRIDFENDETATAPAQRVDVTDQLSDQFDWDTFELTEVGYGDTFIAVPAGGQFFRTTEQMTFNDQTFDVEIEIGLDTQTGMLAGRSKSGGTGRPRHLPFTLASSVTRTDSTVSQATTWDMRRRLRPHSIRKPPSSQRVSRSRKLTETRSSQNQARPTRSPWCWTVNRSAMLC